jgi:RimJ/RimL family protein N-acetyltransferase
MKLATAAGPALVLPTFDGVRELRTQRTLLRNWRDSDLEPWVADERRPRGAALLPSVPRATRPWPKPPACSQPGPPRLGPVGAGDARRAALCRLRGPDRAGLERHFTPAVEIGWRLPRAAWGQGWASEAAAAAAAFALDVLQLDELVAITCRATSRRGA